MAQSQPPISEYSVVFLDIIIQANHFSLHCRADVCKSASPGRAQKSGRASSLTGLLVRPVASLVVRVKAPRPRLAPRPRPARRDAPSSPAPLYHDGL